MKLSLCAFVFLMAALAQAQAQQQKDPNRAPAQGLSLGTGFDYTSGNYTGTSKTDTLYIPFYARYETGPAVFRVTVPYVRITGPGNVVGAGGDRVTLPGASTERRTESGLGDVVLSGFYNVISERSNAIGIDLGAKVKLGTADETKGLGTGKNDYSLQMDLFKPLGDNTLFGSLGHRWYGDPPGVELRNVFYGAVGVSHRFNAQASAGVAYDYRPSIVSGGGEISELTAFWTQRLTGGWRVQPYALVGFGKASPDYGVGTTIAYAY